MRQEQPLPKHGACNLGSINLSEFVINPFTDKAYFDADGFRRAVEISIEALDTVLDENMENHALKEQKEMAYNYRNVGLGIMGEHDFLIKLCTTYGSEKSKEIMDTVMDLMFRTSVITSAKLAKEKGAFPKYNHKVLSSHIIKNHFTESELVSLGIYEYGLRNCSLLSIAPSGSIGTMLNISTGCEPLFQISYKRKTESLKGKEEFYDVYAGVANEFFKETGENELPEFFNTSADIEWRDRVDMQSVLQKHVDTAISSTINLPNKCTLEEIEKLYLYSWEKGLKGVTIFRDGCKRASILTTKNNDNNKDNNANKETPKLGRGMIIKVDNNTIGKERHLITGCGSLHCAAFFDPVSGELLETYLSKGSTGGCQSNLAAVSRLMSLASRGGVDVYTIADQLNSCMTCPSYAVRSATKHDTSKGNSCPSAVGKALIEMYEEMKADIGEEVKASKSVTKKDNKVVVDNIEKLTCPECGSELKPEGGCFTCTSCPYTKCE